MKIEEVLRNNKKKVTPERILLAKWMDKRHLFNSSELIKNFSNISRASVFRTLNLFNEIGYLRALKLSENGETSYEVSHINKHHEHMKCEKCGNVTSFDSDFLCQLISKISKNHSFKMTKHSINIFGECQSCV